MELASDKFNNFYFEGKVHDAFPQETVSVDK